MAKPFTRLVFSSEEAGAALARAIVPALTLAITLSEAHMLAGWIASSGIMPLAART